MPKFASWLTILALLIGLVGAIPASAAPSAQTDLSKVDLNALERQILVEINKVRTNPQEAATILTNAKQNSTPGPYGLEFTLPDSSRTEAHQPYLDSAIATARNLQRMNALVWSDSLAQVAGKYADRNPKGHFAFGTTPSSRMAELGMALGGSAESIDYGGTTGILATYRLYIDSGVSSLGHRKMMINPELTHLGIGCYYKNMYNSITCVLNYAEKWTEKTNFVKLENGKQYAIRDGADAFYYVKLNIKNGKYVFEQCPKPGTATYWPISSAENAMRSVTTPEGAALENRNAKNAPCTADVAPLGVLNNGSAYPTSMAQGNPPAPATPTPSATQPVVKEINETVNVEEEQLYAQRLEGNTFQYVKFLWRDNSGYRFGVCPNATVLAPITLPNTTSMLTPETALANGLTPTNEPCPLNPPTYEIGKLYGFSHGPGHVTYVELLAYTQAANSNTRTYTFSTCGYGKKLDLTTFGPFVAVKTVAQVQQEQRVAENKPCPNLQNGN